MRIISGMAKGVVVKAPDSDKLRPTPDRLKEALFNMLGDVTGANVLELYAGTGNVGLEALSRQAASVWLVDNNSKAVRLMQENREQVEKAGKASSGSPGEVRILRETAFSLPRSHPACRDTFDVVFADPPYTAYPNEVTRMLLSEEFGDWIGCALLIFQHPAKDMTFLQPDVRDKWRLVQQRTYGTNGLTFLENPRFVVEKTE